MKTFELDYYEAKKRLILFLKLRKGKLITDKTIVDFERLVDYDLKDNFKSYDGIEISRDRYNDYRIKEKALRLMNNHFIRLGGNAIYRKVDISYFGKYTDGKHKATIDGKLIEISEEEYSLLCYLCPHGNI